jgi:hypothetical protein
MYHDKNGEKTCRMCHATLPATRENFYKSAKFVDGFGCYCKRCDNSKRKERYMTKASHNINRLCRHCGKHFYAELTKVKRGMALFCSLSCRAKCISYFINYDNRGENNPNAKLKTEEVNQIKELIKVGESCIDISKKFNVSDSHISNIKSGRVWNYDK